MAQRAGAIVSQPDFLPYTRDAVAEFRRKINDGGYSSNDKELILSALDLATVAYQDNDHKSLRMRRQTVMFEGNRVQIPYIQHPLSVAQAMVGEPRLVRLTETADQGAEQIDLKVHQHPYKAEVIAAALLHDVIEDVRLTVDEATQIEGIKKWNDYLKSYFSNLEPNRVNSIITMINAVTKHKELPKKAREIIQESLIFGTIINQLYDSGKTGKDGEAVNEQVTRSLSDLHAMIQRCFGMGSDLHFDDQSFLNFYGALAIKCHDVENNLEDGGVREDKRIRAQLLALFARIYGLPVASRMAAHLIIDTHHDMYWHEGDGEQNLQESIELVREYSHFERSRQKPIFTILGKRIQADAIQIPIQSIDEITQTKGFRPALQFRITVNENNAELLSTVKNAYHAPEGNYLPIKIRNANYLGVPIAEVTQQRILESGRECYYFNVYLAGTDGEIDPDNNKLIAVYRIQDAQPTAHDVLHRDSTVFPTAVPESRLISGVYDGSPKSSMEVFSVMAPSGDHS